MTNFGIIRGVARGIGIGIEANTGNVTNYGHIVGTTFTIRFLSGGTTLTLGPTSFIDGKVVAAGVLSRSQEQSSRP